MAVWRNALQAEFLCHCQLKFVYQKIKLFNYTKLIIHFYRLSRATAQVS